MCVKNNGYISDFFCLNRDVKQGCPISAILFILVTEILSIKIKQDRNIHGIKMKNTTGTLREVKLTQYADDTTFLLEDETSITPLLKLLKTFSEVFRLKIIIDKTECMGIGRLRDIKGYVHGIKINEKPIKSLGIYVGNDSEESMKLNWDDNIKKMKETLVSWKSRDLTIFGKITNIKTLALSKLTFVAQNLIIPDSIIKQINKNIFQFIWGKKYFIVRKLMYKPINEGGANMLNIESFFSALKASWLKKINDSPNSNWCALGRFNLEKITATLNII